MISITHPTRTVPDPVLWMRFAEAAEVETVVHAPLAGNPVVVASSPPPSRVRLALLYDVEADAAAAYDAHRLGVGTPFTITDTGRPTHGLTYVVSGQVLRTLDADNASVWVVEVDVLEVPA